jgi:hypothetical protein
VHVIARGLIAGLAMASLVAAGTVAAAAADSTATPRIDSYVINATVQMDGSLTVSEAVTFASRSEIPDDFDNHLATWRSPDQPERIVIEDLRVDTFDPDPVRFTATYTVSDAFVAFTQVDLSENNPLGLTSGDAEIFAEVIGPLTDAWIREARIEVRTPGPALAAACFVAGRSVPRCTDRIGDDLTTFRSLDLEPGESMTIALVIDGSGVSIPDRPQPDPGEGHFPWPLIVMIVVAIAVALIAAVAWSRRHER